MSLLSSIPGLSNLGPIGKLLDPGALVKDVVNGVLPKNMGVVGDIAGAVFDFNMGNPIGGIQHAMEAVKDLPQATKGAQQQSPQSQIPVLASVQRSLQNLEPSPPPAAAKPMDMNALLSVLKQLTDILTGKKPDAATADAAKTATSDAPPSDTPSKAADTAAKTGAAAGSSAGSSTSMTTTTTTTTTSAAEPQRATPRASDGGAHGRAAETSSWVGTPQTPAPATTAAPAATAPAPATTPAAAATAAPAATPAPAPASTSAAAAGAAAGTAASAATPSTGETISSLAQFNNMSDSAIRDAVIHGRIAPDVAKDQTAMMAIQQRMNAISEMNNLMTNMMRALHDMQMAVVQNIRI